MIGAGGPAFGEAAPMSIQKPRQPVPGTAIFDGEQARKGYALNRMCYYFNDAASRRAFVDDEDACCAKYGLKARQREAIRNRNVLQLIESGGNAYPRSRCAAPGKKILGQNRPVGLASSLEAPERKLDWYTFHRRGQHLKVCFPSGTRSSDVFIVGDFKRQ
jgi:protocatechuate 4,5-dioxygenase alpha subunit